MAGEFDYFPDKIAQELFVIFDARVSLAMTDLADLATLLI